MLSLILQCLDKLWGQTLLTEKWDFQISLDWGFRIQYAKAQSEKIDNTKKGEPIREELPLNKVNVKKSEYNVVWDCWD